MLTTRFENARGRCKISGYRGSMNKRTDRNEICQYWFKDMDRFQMTEFIDRKINLSIFPFKDMIDRIHLQYPFIDKTQIAMIVKRTFIVIRRLLILGEHISLDKLLSIMKLMFVWKRGVCAMVSVNAMKFEDEADGRNNE